MRTNAPLVMTALAMAIGQAYAQPVNDSVNAYSYWALPPGGNGPGPNYTVYYDGKSLVFKEGLPPPPAGITNNQLGVNNGDIVKTTTAPTNAQQFDWNGYVAMAPARIGIGEGSILPNNVGPIGYNSTPSTTQVTQVNDYGNPVVNTTARYNGKFVGTATVNNLVVNINRNNNLRQNYHPGAVNTCCTTVSTNEGYTYGGSTPAYGGTQFTIGSDPNLAVTGLVGPYGGGIVADGPPTGLSSDTFWTKGTVYFQNANTNLQATSAPFVAGIASQASAVAAMGNVSASYFGSTLLGSSINGPTAVAITVQFGSATWSGSFTDSNFNSNIGSNANFSATGTISGVNLNGTATAGARVLSGTVNGNFVGPIFNGVIGKTDITYAGAYGGTVNLKDAFWATRFRRPI